MKDLTEGRGLRSSSTSAFHHTSDFMKLSMQTVDILIRYKLRRAAILSRELHKQSKLMSIDATRRARRR